MNVATLIEPLKARKPAPVFASVKPVALIAEATVNVPLPEFPTLMEGAGFTNVKVPPEITNAPPEPAMIALV